MRLLLLPLAALTFTPLASATDLRVYPPEVAIGGPNRTQQLLVVEEENGRTVRDLTATATFSSSDAKTAKVDAKGVATGLAVGAGRVVVTAGGKTVEVAVKVDAASEWTFRNHIVPTLTRAGCNAGACHGALAGKGGMKLSLRGYDPETDWFVTDPSGARAARRSHQAGREPAADESSARHAARRRRAVRRRRRRTTR